MSNGLAQSESVSGRSARTDIFPLRLSDFEYYMLVDDRPSHPMVFVMAVMIDGRLNEHALQSALDEAVQEHVLLNCRVRNDAGQGWCWVPQPSVSVSLEWRILSDLQSFGAIPVREIDLRQQAGLQVQVEVAADTARVVFHIHHSCCDGIAALQFIGEVFARYGQKTAAPHQKLPQFDEVQTSQLLLRERFESADRGRTPRKRRRARAIAKAARLILRRPIPLRTAALTMSVHASENTGANVHVPATDSAGVQGTEQHSALVTVRLPRSVSRGLLTVATGQGVTANDLCLREMLLLLREWNHGSSPVSDNAWLRIAVPLSMRTPEHAGMPAANLVSYGFVTRRAGECRDPEMLLKSIHQQTGDLLFMREGIVFLKCVRFLRAIPGALKALLGFKSCFCTVVVANVGDLRRRFSGRFPLQDGCWQAGDVVISNICGVAPVRPNTSAAVTLGDYGGHTSVHLRTDPAVFSPQQTKQFLDAYLNRLTALSQSQMADPAADSAEGSSKSQP